MKILFLKFFIGLQFMNCTSLAKTFLEIDSSTLRHVGTLEQFYEIPIIKNEAYTYLSALDHKEHTSRYIFIRHGESTSNVEKSIAGRVLDVDLSPKGKEQVYAAHSKFSNTAASIHAIYSSPSLRALSTASLFYPPLEIKKDERLYEKFYGPYEGASEEAYKPVKELEENQNSGSGKPFSEKFRFKAHPEMESMSNVYTRVMHFLLEKHEEHQGQNVIVSTHNGIIKALFMSTAALMGFDVDYRSFNVDNAAIFIVEMSKEGLQVKAASGLSFKTKL